MQQEQIPEGSQNNQNGQQTKQKQSKRGKPKGMNGFPKLEKSEAWSSIQQSTQIIQTLTRFGRFINFQQTGKKTKTQQLNTNQENGIFLQNNDQLSIVKTLAEICQTAQKNNKNCFVFFFASDYPEFIIQDGVPKLQNDYSEYKEYDPLFQIASMMSQKFLKEFALYLKVEKGESELKIQDLFTREENKKLETADTILQTNFVKYLIEPKKMLQKMFEKNLSQQKVHEYYTEYYNEKFCRQDYETNVMELLGCMSIDDNADQYKDQQ